MNVLRQMVERHKSGVAAGIYSLCSAHPLVIEAALTEARKRDLVVLVEATCNQVNQYGGYTAMRPADFRDFVAAIGRRLGIAPGQVVLGGDHLGPSPWQQNPAAVGLEKAAVLVDQYVRAGFRKIHLDCSMACADDPAVLPGEVIAQRTAKLCQVAEAAWQDSGGEAPCYVIGTEVPTPGGETDGLGVISVTQPERAASTLNEHREEFRTAGIEGAWSRVVGLVVQPGVDFDHDQIVDFAPAKAQSLSAYIEKVPGIVYEAHSTDYQTGDALAQLVRGHFAILKVGPGATFALREAYWALAEIEELLVPPGESSKLKDVLLGAMRDDPQHWQRYYRDPARQLIQQQFSLSDRIRYYWPLPGVRAACFALHANLDRVGIPLALLSQYLPHAFSAVRERGLAVRVHELVREAVAVALRPYIAACNP
jgi:D-tagatose-1,6-bisphosphate aldolase subunit GatZ/KbaZ